MKITVKPRKGDNFEVETSTEATIESVKRLIAEKKSEYPADLQKLTYSGRILTDDITVGELNIQPEEFIVVKVAKAKARPLKEAHCETRQLSQTLAEARWEARCQDRRLSQALAEGEVKLRGLQEKQAKEAPAAPAAATTPAATPGPAVPRVLSLPLLREDPAAAAAANLGTGKWSPSGRGWPPVPPLLAPASAQPSDARPRRPSSRAGGVEATIAPLSDIGFPPWPEVALARESSEAETAHLKKRLQVLEQDGAGLRRSLLAESAAHSKSRQDSQKAIADLTAEVKRKQDDAEGMWQTLARQQKSFEDQLRAKEEAIADLTAEEKRKQDDAEGVRQTLARQQKSFEDQLRKKEEALAEAMRVSSNLWAKLQDVAALATASFAQWFWSDNQGEQLPFGLAENLQVETAHQAFCSRSSSTELFELKIGGYQYIIDFGNMLQTNMETRKKRSLTRKVVDGGQTEDVVEKVRQALVAKAMEVAAQQMRAIQDGIGAHKDAAGLEGELRAAKAGEQDLRRRLEEAEQKLQEALADTTAQKAQHDAALAKSIETEAGERRKAVEFWRAQAPGACLVIEPLVLQVQRILQASSHTHQTFRGSPSQCTPFQQIRVHSVQAVHNPTSHRAYQLRLETMSSSHTLCKMQAPPLPPVATSVALSALFPGIALNAKLNEVLLLHGCKDGAASSIVEEGFDIRHTRSGSLYGEGVYFASEACKSHQYTDATGTAQLRHMFIARVALGDPAFLTEKYQGRHPPTRACGLARYDSAVVDPAKSTCNQQHWEYVVYKGEQACPELLVTYSV